MDVNLVLAAAVVMIGVAVSFLYLLLGRRPGGWKPRDSMEWVGSTLSVALIFSAIALIIVGLDAANQPLSIVAVSADGTASEIIDMAVDSPAPDFAFTSLADGSQMRLSALEGKVVLLNFWATWCAPCLQEMPELNRLHQDYADRGLVVVNVSDEPPTALASFGEQFGLETLSAYTPMGERLPPPFATAYEVRPTSFVIDRTGQVKRYIVGARSYMIFERYVTPYL